jgi:translation initiation factor 1
VKIAAARKSCVTTSAAEKILKSGNLFRGAVITPRTGTAKTTTPATTPDARKQAQVRVGREVAGRGGKGVSVISGLPLSDADLAALATQLKKACGAGGAAREGRIEIQGDHRDRLVGELQKLGYQAKRSGG